MTSSVVTVTTGEWRRNGEMLMTSSSSHVIEVKDRRHTLVMSDVTCDAGGEFTFSVGESSHCKCKVVVKGKKFYVPTQSD